MTNSDIAEIDSKQPTLPATPVQTVQLRVSGLIPGGAGVAQTGITADVASRTAFVPGEQRDSPGRVGGHVLSDVLQAGVLQGQAKTDAIRDLVDRGILTTADNTGTQPRASFGSGGTAPQSRAGRERANADG